MDSMLQSAALRPTRLAPPARENGKSTTRSSVAWPFLCSKKKKGRFDVARTHDSRVGSAWPTRTEREKRKKMHYDLGVAHLGRAAACMCPWPLPTDRESIEIMGIFAYLPSLALEEVFWHHLVGEALRAAEAALTDEKNEDDDVTDVEVLRAWLGSAYAPLCGSPEFCRVARRLLTAWSEIADAHFGTRDLAWRGVSHVRRPDRGSATCVQSARRAGKTTIAVRIARVLKRRVKHVVCVVSNDGDLGQVFAGLGISDYEATRTDDGHRFGDSDVGDMWGAVGPLVRAYAHEGVLVLVDDLYWATEQSAPLIDEIANLGVHLVVTSEGMISRRGLSTADRLIWLCRRKEPWFPYGIESFACVTGIDCDRVIAAYDACACDATTRVTLVAQRRRNDTWDLQVMPYAAPSLGP
ncbi:hypothetical protein psal_cds_1396 [Pandoravirus salinus]|uniref:Uncharacterized protein n=1 Tax=Pandoravirus salinus TaxID=1349410 RepID=S4VYN7_9VIRU|nr:hypothetical protein psal_cds_1396 [Pandoravirus salinus]AGO85819.2 hypothetical protein psal_cds_1396 [Pandoravirus salinus]